MIASVSTSGAGTVGEQIVGDNLVHQLSNDKAGIRLCLIKVGVRGESKGTRKQGHGQETARVRDGKPLGAGEGWGERAHVKEWGETAGGRQGERGRESKEGVGA